MGFYRRRELGERLGSRPGPGRLVLGDQELLGLIQLDASLQIALGLGQGQGQGYCTGLLYMGDHGLDI